MASLRDIRRRRRAVENIQQITRAMYLVAAAKMRRTEEQVRSGRPYAQKLAELLGRLSGVGLAEHPLLAERPVRRSLVMVVSGNRGLAGSYNHQVHRYAHQRVKELADEVEQVDLVTAGRKAGDYFRSEGFPLTDAGIELGEEVSFLEARQVARNLTERFLAGEADEVRVIYTQFLSAVSQEVTEARLLPIEGLRPEEEGEPGADEDAPASLVDMMGYIYEPSPSRVFDELLPKSVEIQTYRFLLEAKASEHASRMHAMKNATDNADDLIENLTLMYNRARQAAITAEIADIVGGAEALRF